MYFRQLAKHKGGLAGRRELVYFSSNIVVRAHSWTLNLIFLKIHFNTLSSDHFGLIGGRVYFLLFTFFLKFLVFVFVCVCVWSFFCFVCFVVVALFAFCVVVSHIVLSVLEFFSIIPYCYNVCVMKR